VICVNNRDEIEWEEDMTVSDLLDRLDYTFPRLIVKIDGGVITRENFANRTVPDGADVKVIHLLAGG
jgi:thiamine biosynthesis protein ThiS